jgi:hypothetical protein
LQATEDAGTITLNLNGRAWRISKKNFPGFELTTLDGRRFVSGTLPPEIVEIERNGPLHAIVHMRGRLPETGKKREKPVPGSGVVWDCRFHAFAGSDLLEVETSYEQQEHISHLAIRSIGLTLPVSPAAPAADPVQVALAAGGELELPPPPSDGDLVLTQLHQYFGEGRYDLVIDTGSTSRRRENTRATGAVRFPDIAVAVADFDNMNPAAIAWSPGRVTIYAQPPRHATYVELPFGISQTLRHLLAPPTRAGWSAVRARAANPLRVFPDPAHVARTGVFGGPWLTAGEAMERFPLFERPLREFFSTFARDIQRQDTTGGFDFGDAGNPGGWKNNETSLIESLFLQYLRGGDPALFRRASIMARQFRDTAILHAGTNSKWIQTHAAGLHTNGHWHAGHYWTTGLIAHYLLTGDKRSLETVRGAAAGLLSRHKLRYTGRERARVLLHLAELYELTHYKILRAAFGTHLAHDVPLETGAYYAGLEIVALEKGRSVFGRLPALANRLANRLEAYEKHLRDKGAWPLETIGEDRDHFLYQAAAALAARTGEAAFLRAVADRMAAQALSAHGMGINAVRGAAWLWQAERLGVPLSPLTPAHPAGIALLTGRAGGQHDATLTFRIRPATGASSPAVVRLYKQIGFRAGKGASDDVLAYRLVSGNAPVRASGNVPVAELAAELAAGTLAGPRFRVLDLPPLPASSVPDARLTLHCGGDAQAELSVSHASVSLAADDWLFFRQHRHGNGFVRFDITPATAPATAAATAEIVIALDWRFADPGSVAAVELLDPQGKVIAHARRARPLGADWEDTGVPYEDPSHLVLHLPPGADSAAPLRMEMQAAKWLGWRVETGLKEPWLGVPDSQPAQP